eukprot:361921-Chlamydomonas_euryale.AAC.2
MQNEGLLSACACAQEERQGSARNSKRAAAAAAAADPKGAFQVATFGGGCFWCSEAVFSEVRGVVSTRCGYAGGKTAAPTYEDVSSGRSGHAEVVEVTFDNGVVSYRDLLKVGSYLTKQLWPIQTNATDTAPVQPLLRVCWQRLLVAGLRIKGLGV